MAKALPITAVRLRERMEEVGEDQAGLAEAVGATQGAISQILTGLTRNSRLLPKIAHALSVNLDWLVGTSDEKIDMFDEHGDNISEDDLAAIRAGRGAKRLVKPDQIKRREAPPSVDAVAEDLGLVPVREFDLALGMGASFLDSEARYKVQHFPREWLRTFTHTPPEDLFFAHAVGDSMQPTMVSGDIILIDQRQRVVEDADLIWAMTYQGMGMIKRIGPARGGQIEIISDNQSVRSRFVMPDDVHVIGRIVAVVRKM